MARTVVIDEIHLSVRVPANLPDADTRTIHRALLGSAFMGRLRRAVRTVVRAFPELTKARMSLSR